MGENPNPGELTGLLIDGRWCDSARRMDVLDKFTGELVTQVCVASPEQVHQAVTGALRASDRPLPPARREAVLLGAADLLEQRADQIMADYIAETGFTPADARAELARAVGTLRLCAGEAVRIAGEEVPLAATPGSEHRLAFTTRVPVGVVAAIAPFNAPLNTVAHKVGPALAAGNAVVLKPAQQTPLSAIALVRALLDAGLPAGFLQLVCGSGAEMGDALVGDPRVRFLTFTGSTSVGLQIKQRSGIAKTHLELGANSASIVAPDADLELVAELASRAGFRKAGQVCTSVQRLLVHRTVIDELASRLAVRVDALRGGDPRADGTDVGPMISAREATRAERWVTEAAADTGKVLTGGQRSGSVLTPTLVLNPGRDSKLMIEEIFAPVVAMVAVDSVDAAIDEVNAGPYGLQAGIFSQDLDVAFDAAQRLKVGGVMINDTSSYHADAMPYGGVKSSGYGLEGPRYAVQEMTDPRIIVLNLRPAHARRSQ